MHFKLPARGSIIFLTAHLTAALLAIPTWAGTAFDSASSPADSDLHVLRVTPEGLNVPSENRQIVISFDRPVVPLGVMAVDTGQVPVSIAPTLACHWHWLDTRSLACELDQAKALAPATEYQGIVTHGLTAIDGSRLASDYRWTFRTELPQIKEYAFQTWRSPGTPVIRLVFDQPVTAESVTAALSFTRSKGRKADPSPTIAARVKPDPRTDGRAWLVEPANELPLDTSMQLRVAPGIRGSGGPLLGMEHRTVVEFDTFPRFRFLGVSCLVGGKATTIGATAIGATTIGAPTIGATATARAACNPLGSVSLMFSAPVIAPEIKAHLHLTPDLVAGRTDYDPWANVYPNSRLGAPFRRGMTFAVALPERLQAYQDYRIADLKGVRDEFGRPLQGIDTMTFRTDHRPPRLKIGHPVVVLEKDVPTQMPIYVTNLTDVTVQYRTLTATGESPARSVTQAIDRPWDISYATPLKLRDLLEGKSGVVAGSVRAHPTPPSAAIAGDDEGDAGDDPGVPRGRPDRDFFAEVTPFQVHVKLGAYNTLVWVTSLSQGVPVAHARVRLYQDHYLALSANPDVLAEGQTDQSGIAILPGRLALDRQNASPAGGSQKTFMVRVDSKADIAVLPLDDSFMLDTYRASRGQFWSGYGSDENHIHVWGTTAQGIYKLGDTIQYKLYVRNQNNLTLEPAAQRQGYQLDVLDPTGKTVSSETNLGLSTFGAIAGSFRVPSAGAVGWYEFRLSTPAAKTVQAGGGEATSWTAMRVLVADFTPAPFQVQTTLNGQSFQPGDRVDVSTKATLHGGGPYASAASRVTARLLPQSLEFSSTEANGFEFASQEPNGQCGSQRTPDELTVHQSEQQLDAQGNLSTQFQLPDADFASAKLEVESAVRDERGKFVANLGLAEYHGRDRFVGLHTDHWTFEQGKPAALQYLVVDTQGKPVAGVPVNLVTRVQVVHAARVKGAGDAYLTSFDPQWEPAGKCTASSTNMPQTCGFTPSRPGLYSVAASIKDTHGRPHTTEMCLWVTGKGRTLWEEPADMSLSLVPEKQSYQVGEHARYLVKNPFPGAQALITIERFGVIKHWVQTLDGNTPVVEFTVEPDFVPGFYLSVMIVSPRVAPAPGASALDANGVDLGRPTYRIGYVKVPVSDPYKSLDVHVNSDRPTYKPRDTVKLDLSAAPHKGAPIQEPIEFAVAVLDAAVFDLIKDGVSYFDPYRGLYQFDNLDLVNYTLLARLLGLQKFEKKGANSGGDGGAGFDMRTVTKYLAYWNPSVPADGHGHAAVSFALPDNLTGWKVFAIAVTPGDRMGLGSYEFKSNKLTELRPVLPNQLTARDRFTAGFSVLNRSTKRRTVAVTLTAKGPIEGAAATIRRAVTLDPFQRDTVWLPLVTVAPGTLTLTATAGDKLDKDALSQTVPVRARVSLDVAASYGTTVSDAVDESLHYPADMMPGVGELSLTLTPTVIGNLDGAFRYLRDYPYECWEQRLSKALLAQAYQRLHGYLGKDLVWPEADALPQKLLDDAASFQAPNGGMTFWGGQDERVSPYLSVATALAFNQLRAAGHQVPADVQKNLDAYLERLLREKAVPTFYSDGMVSTVRAVALEARAQRQQLTLADLRRYETSVPQMDLFGLAAYLEAALQVKGAETVAASAARQILAHTNQSGGKLQFSETINDGYSQLLTTPLRSECAVLTALLHYAQTAPGAAQTGDLPFKLVSSITQARGSRDHWENTQENLYCTNALAEYASLYEQQTPALDVQASLDGTPLGKVKFTALTDPPTIISRPNGDQDAGRSSQLKIQRTGQGRLYYATRLTWSPTELAAHESNAGIEVHREYSVQRQGHWQLLPSPVTVKRGELLRVDLYLSLPAPRNFVVVEDPVPGGLEAVNRDLATASTVDADATDFAAAGGAFWFKFSDWNEYGVSLWSFYHRELKADAARFFADYLPAGHYHLSYGAQAIAEGQFGVAPTKAEEMYNPDVYGKALPAQVVVGHD